MWSHPQETTDWSHLLQKFLIENFIFCVVYVNYGSGKLTIWFSVDLVFNLLFPGAHQKGHTYLNSAAGLFKYVWPFSGHRTLKD